MRPMNSFKTEELERRIDEVLFYFWDPMGVSPEPKARGEYRSYARKIYEMLKDGRDAFKISSYLCELESGMLAKPPNEDRALTVAKLLLDHQEAIEAGCS
jgi:hypothetical protein